MTQRALERVQPGRQLADRLVKQSAAHLDTARSATDDDAVGALQLADDAARKAAIALLAAQGLRGQEHGLRMPSSGMARGHAWETTSSR